MQQPAWTQTGRRDLCPCLLAQIAAEELKDEGELKSAAEMGVAIESALYSTYGQ